jgi:hypothetical protein
MIWIILHSWSKNRNWCSLWRTGHCPVPRLETSMNWPLSGFLRARPLKFRTIRCATGLSGETTEQRPTSLTVDCGTVWPQKSEDSLRCQIAPDCLVCRRTVRCRKKTEDFNGQQLQTPTVGWCGTHRTVNNVVSGAPPYCSVCPSIATTRVVVGAINTTQPPSFKTSKHSNILIQY